VTSNANSLLQAGIAEDALPVQGAAGIADVLWITEIEWLLFFCFILFYKPSAHIAGWG